MLNWGNKFANFGKAAGTICICALLVIALTFTGCVGADPGDPSPGEDSAPSAENVDFKIQVNNPLELTPVQGEETQGYTRTAWSYSTISGLKDKEVEGKINDRITSLLEEQKIAEVPPYRGIKVRVTDEYVPVDQQIYVNQQGSFNNLLSFTLYRSVTYAHQDEVAENEKDYWETGVYVSDMIPLVFDLNTGEEVQLKDLFHDDVEYMNLLNQWMSDHLAQASAMEEGWYSADMSVDLKLVGPFKGISPDQPFYISSYGLSLVFGPEDTQFATPYGFYTSSALIPYQDLDGNWALGYRFLDEDVDLYEDEAPAVYSLMSMTDESAAGVADYYQEDGISYNLSLRYQDDLPENVKAKILELGTFDESINAELKDSLTSEGDGYYDVSVYSSLIGDFISLNFYESAYGYGFEDNGQGYVTYEHYQNRYYCYHAETGEEVQLEDLFKEEYDPDEVIRNAMFRQKRELIDLYEGKLKPDALVWEEVDLIYENISSFSVDTTCLSFLSSITDEETGETRREWISLPYEYLGCDKMTIFD